MKNVFTFKPAVPRCWLFVASGGLWSTVGVMMCVSGAGWVDQHGWVRGAGFMLAGFILALIAARWGFSGQAEKNIRRLRRLPEQGCFFAFQAWRSYFMILGMVILGAALRQSPVPKTILAVLYTAIGGALVIGSHHYYRHLARLIRAGARRRAVSRIRSADPVNR